MLVRRTLSPVALSSVEFDRTFQQLVRSFSTPAVRRSPLVHATTDGGGTLAFTVDLPGVPAEGVAVEVSGRTLTVKVEHDGQSWQRSTRLGTQYDLDTVTANYADGRLTVTVGTAPAPEARKVAVTVGAPAPAAVTAGESSEPVEVTSEVTEG